jgi:hypothetical protein
MGKPRAFLAESPRTAHPTSRARLLGLLALLLILPLSAMAQGLCNGRYKLAEEMLDAAYGRFGTIYTGGPGSSYSGADIGPTIDLYRLWHGLPDLRFRDAQEFDYTRDWGRDFGGFGDTADDLALILRIASRPQAKGLTEEFRYVTARYLNTMVDAGSGPGWWLAPGPSDQSDRQKLVMAAATPGSLMEWLLVMMALSDTPQAVAWVNDGAWATSTRDHYDMRSPFAQVRTLVANRRASEPGLEWQVAAHIVKGGPGDFSHAVQTCTATNAEYAADAVAGFHRLEGRATHPDRAILTTLPDKMRNLALGHLAMVAVRDLGRAPDDPANREVLDWIATNSPSPDFTAWLNVGRVWAAQNMAEVIALLGDAPLDRRTIDTLNLLSLHDLTLFADQAKLPADQQGMVMTVVATRAFVLGDQVMARRHLSTLAPLMPDYTAVISAALNGPGGAEVQNARALLALPRPTVWLRSYDNDDMQYAQNAYRFSAINLPLRFVSAGVLNRDLASWMLEPFMESRRYWGWSGADRARRRGRVYHDPYARPFIPDDFEYDAGYPFLRLIAWDELGRLDLCHGLTQRLSAVLIHWVDQDSASWLKRLLTDQTTFPEVLRRVIVLNKVAPGALVDGRPAGQRAFALLSSRFADTPAGQATKYWYHTDQGCQP